MTAPPSQDRRAVAELPGGNTLQATPVIANGILYIGTRSGGAEAFAAKQAATRECPRPKAYHLCMLTISS